ncbi:DNA translocase FtsK [Filibacter tadaridae]|uniref:DNA translocase SftA n=1 Tax=Filibacter tadaridae TaxID=2483811 RepID=A0A3P5XGX8_9BACL|nr:DNA translocase FtsK [Filibacter tadaridae]VDC26843.1 DNA translocase SftA [Filibacter tadaridae]
MKRVIDLSWLKIIVNRLFGPEEDNTQEFIYDDHDNENVEPINKIDKTLEPSFRFPIVSDAEIYGWDDDEPPVVRDFQESVTRKTPEEDDYVPIPLYENDRWLGEQPSGKVFKSGSTPKYRVDKEYKRNDFSPVVDKKTKKYQSDKKETIQKRSNRPFLPSEVPSPVYGFLTPKKQMMPTVIKEEIEFVKSAVELEKVIPFEEEIKLDASPIEESNLPTNRIETEKLNLEKEYTDGITIDEPVHISEEVLNETNESELQKVEQAEAELIPEKRTERIVPFNVMMLKSDKEKLHVNEQIKPQPKKENDVEKYCAPTNHKPEKPITQLQEVKETVADSSDNKIVSEIESEEEEPYYAFPSLDYLIAPELQIEDTEWLESQSEKLEEALSYFAVQANVIEAMQGPTVTRFELTVGQGTKVSKVRNLTDDLKLALAAEDIRIQAPIPGTSSIGIEIPNRKTRPVRISEVIRTDEFKSSTSPLEAVLGLSLTGKPVTLDLRKMPHGMIAGATGSGKSVCINSILVSLLYKAAPTDLKLMLIDPKMVELAPYNGIPHLISPVITDVKAATAALKWAVAEMERRYELLAHAGVRDIERYNKLVIESRRFSLKMPYLLIVIDELADLMMIAPADVEVSISRIAQKARACGIHLIIATQRPSVDVITGTIKANIPTRIAFSVSSQIDSRTIIDTPGADRLLGKGDMLYIGNGKSSPVRLQGTFVTDTEIERIIEHVRNEAKPDYLFGQEELLASSVEEEETDSLFDEVCVFIMEQGSASTSLLQRNFSIGYNRAAKLMDRMEKSGFISGQKGSKARDVYLTENDIARITGHSERLDKQI